MSEVAVRIEPLTKADVAPAVDLAVRVLRVKPGDRREQFAADITGQYRQMFVAKARGQVVAYGRTSSWQPTRQVRGLRLATTSAVSWSTRHGEAGASPLR